MSPAPDDALVVALARATVERAAPEELVLFPAASEAYLHGRDPSKATRGDPMLGFGIETAVVLLTPVALTVAKDVLGFLRAQLKKRAEEQGEEAVDWLIDRLLRRNGDEPAADPGLASIGSGTTTVTKPDETLELTDEQLEQVRRLALEKAQLLELPDEKAKLLADSLVGSLATA